MVQPNLVPPKLIQHSALVLSDEQQELRSTVRRLLRDKGSTERVRETMATDEGFDRALWRQMAEQIGLQALAVPDKYDGVGQSSLETQVVFEEMGRALYCGPYLSTVGMAVPALVRSGDTTACEEFLPGIAAGVTIAALAVAEDDGSWDGLPATTARRADGGWALEGAKSFVVDGHVADLLLVTAAVDGDLALFAVAGDDAGVTRSPQESLDLTRRLSKIDFSGATGRLIDTEVPPADLVAGVLDRVLVAVAAEQAGGAAACLDLSVEYATSREQFGRPIGSFQAVAHKCVDMLAQVEFARATARYAAAADASGSAEFPVAARVAAAYCGDAYRKVATETIQVHGGTGFTWEHDAHLYYRRAWSTQHLFGGSAAQHAAIADRLGL